MITADSGRVRQGSRAVRRRQGAAGHQPDLLRHPVQPGGPAGVRHGDLRRCRRQDQRRHRSRRAGAGRLADRCRRASPRPIPRVLKSGRRAAAAGRHRGLQGHRPGRDRRNPVGAADRSWIRCRTNRAAQRRLLHGGVQRCRVPRPGHFQAGSHRVRAIPESHSAGTGLHRSLSIRARSNSGRSRIAARTASRSKTRPGTKCAIWRKATAWPTSWGSEWRPSSGNQSNGSRTLVS